MNKVVNKIFFLIDKSKYEIVSQKKKKKKVSMRFNLRTLSLSIYIYIYIYIFLYILQIGLYKFIITSQF